MKELLHTLSHTGLSGFGNMLLTGAAVGVAFTVIGMTALYVVKYAKETPELRTLECMIGVERSDCPRYGAEMDALKGKLSDLAEKTATAESKLANLRAVETAVDEVTLFTSHDDPYSAYNVMVGTVYSRLVEPDSAPEYFCYIGLSRGTANEDRNLHLYTRSGPVELDGETLRKAGVSTETLAFARSVCKPFLIGRAS